MPEHPGQKYAFANLMRAIAAGSEKRTRQWNDVLLGMLSGDLAVGSRTPVAGMPEWATPEVIRGGFATTAFAAGGDLRAHERSLAEALALPETDPARVRLALNNWHLSDEGLSRLREMARTGAYSAETPEETALLVVALLLESAPEDAEATLVEIAPFFDRLRFYPAPGERSGDEGVFVRSVAELREVLKARRTSAAIRAQHATLTRWIPLNDRLIDLLAERDRPHWGRHAAIWLQDYENAKRRPAGRRWRKLNLPFQRCRQALEGLLGGASLPARTLADIDDIIARHRAKYGDAEARAAWRRAQAAQDVTVWHDTVARLVSDRLARLSPDIGISAPERVSGPIAAAEAREGAPAGTPLPKPFVRAIESARMGPIADLIRTGQIGAPEVLASVLPQMTAALHANGLPTEAEAEVCASLYRAFRRRRSMLLLYLQSQVRLDELPWAAALLKRRDGGDDGRALARETLTALVRLSLTHFPHVIFPNLMIREMSALDETAGFDIPFTGELAADIFHGAFSEPFMRAADISLARYAGKLYGRYYNLPEVRRPGDGRSFDLAVDCARRAGVRLGGAWSAVANGMIIEQQQIVTSHNLAQLFGALDLGDLDHAAMATDCFRWICRRQQVLSDDWRANLQLMKNSAYAWRQMVAFLSELETARQQAAFAALEGIFADQPAAFRDRFAPALDGLGRAVSGETLVDRNAVFLGWTRWRRHPFAL